jgi:dTDP-4-amino-4,6-dideoxygalactose transaminase
MGSSSAGPCSAPSATACASGSFDAKGAKAYRGPAGHRRRIYGFLTSMPISLFDTETPLAPLRERILERLETVVDAGHFVLGPEVRAFEAELASYLGVRQVVGVANGTDAITIAIRALGVRPGDEVVLPSFTFYATAEAVITAGATPVFCDVDLETRNVTPETVRAVLTPRTTAVVAVDLFGCPAPVPELRELGLPVLEDAAQAMGGSLGGHRAGALGDVATISFYPSKNLGCFGDGGAIATDDDELAELARALRFHGSRDKQSFEYVGYNSRLDELQAAILRVLLPELDGWTRGRRAAAAAYLEAGLAEHVTVPSVPDGADPAWHLYIVNHERAEPLIAELGREGIQARGYYRTPVHRQPAMAPFASGSELPATDALARTNFALPMSPVLGADQARQVVAAIATALAA